MRVIVAGDPRQGRARLALAAGADQHDPVARDVAGLVLGQKARQIVEIAVLARRLVDPPQRAADQRDIAAMGRRRLRDRLEPRNIRGEAGDCDPRIVAADQIGQGPAQLAPRSPKCRAAARWSNRRRSPGRLRRRACVKARLVRGRADQRIGIELPVAGMQDGADRRARARPRSAPGSNGSG